MEIEPKFFLHINKEVNEKNSNEKFLPMCPDFLLCLFFCRIVSPICHDHYNIEMNTFYSLYYDLNRVFEFFWKMIFLLKYGRFLWSFNAVFSKLYELLCLFVIKLRHLEEYNEYYCIRFLKNLKQVFGCVLIGGLIKELISSNWFTKIKRKI